MTEMLFLTDAYLAGFEASIVEVGGDGIALDRTAFYPTGGGQPHDLGTLEVSGESFAVTGVRKQGSTVWHAVESSHAVHHVRPGDEVKGRIDWQRRHQLMRTHTAAHILSGVIWNTYGTLVTGGNMEPLSARMDFEFAVLPEGFSATVEDLVNAEIAADRPVRIEFLSRSEAMDDPELIRTKVNLIPESVTEIRVVDIVGLDRQADGGTHVASTAEVGSFTVAKTESKGKGNKRIRYLLSE